MLAGARTWVKDVAWGKLTMLGRHAAQLAGETGGLAYGESCSRLTRPSPPHFVHGSFQR